MRPLECAGAFALLTSLAAVLACGGDTRVRADGGATPIPPPAVARDASALADRFAPPVDLGSEPDMAACPVGQSQCSGSCVDLQSDPANCGACGIECRSDGCVRGECGDTCGVPGIVLCGDDCVDVLNDPAHCGDCETVCAGGTFCVGGECACPEPRILCDGICVNPQSDNQHCGACGNECTSGGFCTAGICSFECSPLDLCPTGCADLQNDPNNCGACNVMVPAGFVCQAGMAVCPPGTLECASTCVALNDPDHCGGCGIRCPDFCLFDLESGLAECVERCVEPQVRCGSTCVDLRSDVTSCGACGISCGGGSSCIDSTCSCGSRVDCDPRDDFLDCRDADAGPCP